MARVVLDSDVRQLRYPGRVLAETVKARNRRGELLVVKVYVAGIEARNWALARP
jgi:hypothetical protein